MTVDAVAETRQLPDAARHELTERHHHADGVTLAGRPVEDALATTSDEVCQLGLARTLHRRLGEGTLSSPFHLGRNSDANLRHPAFF